MKWLSFGRTYGKAVNTRCQKWQRELRKRNRAKPPNTDRLLWMAISRLTTFERGLENAAVDASPHSMDARTRYAALARDAGAELRSVRSRSVLAAVASPGLSQWNSPAN
jgi:hypothetical protein